MSSTTTGKEDNPIDHMYIAVYDAYIYIHMCIFDIYSKPNSL